MVMLPGRGAGAGASTVLVSLPPQADASKAAARAESRAMRAGCRVLKDVMGGFLEDVMGGFLEWNWLSSVSGGTLQF